MSAAEESTSAVFAEEITRIRVPIKGVSLTVSLTVMSSLALIPYFPCPDATSSLNKKLTEADRAVVPSSTAQVPAYADEAVRLQSFKHWFFMSDKSPEMLAAAGLYFMGSYHGSHAAIHDLTRCFWCGTVFGCWMPEDDCIAMHLDRRPDCLFISSLGAGEPNGTAKKRMRMRWLQTTPVQELLKLGLISSYVDPAFEYLYENRLDFPPDLVSMYQLVARLREQEVRDFAADPDSLACLTCENQAIVLNSPCGHVTSCLACSRKSVECLRCRVPVTGRMIVRLS